MGILDKIKEAGKKAASEISKTIKTAQVQGRQQNEAFHRKREILSNLSLDELPLLSLFYLVL